MKKRIYRKMAVLGMVLMLLLSFSVAVFAAAGVPDVVMDARSSVVRIVSLRNNEALSSGSGFVVGRGKELYIVTNWHATFFKEYKQNEIEFAVYYDESVYVMASLLNTSPGRDLAILKPNKKIPGLKPLTLQTGEVKAGAVGYALGYPGSADILSGSFLTGKDSITITNGIISGIRHSPAGDGSLGDVQLLQTNIAISGGNSGGPLLNSEGAVIGVNTMGISETSTFGCIHVQEVIEFLEESDVPYLPHTGVAGILLWIAAAVAVLGAAVLVLWRLRLLPQITGFVSRKQAKSLIDAIAAGSGPLMDEYTASVAAKSLLLEMSSLRQKFLEGALPLSADYVYITWDNRLTFRFPKAGKNQSAAAQTENSLVYFAGAVLYGVRTGSLPPGAADRSGGVALKLGNDALAAVIRKAMELDAPKRFSSILVMLDTLNNITPYVKKEESVPSPAAAVGFAEDKGQNPPAGSLKVEQPRKRIKKSLVFAGIAAVLVVTFIIYSSVQFVGGKNALESQDYLIAEASFERAPWLQLLFKNEYIYARAMSRWERGRYEESLEELEKLSDYDKAEEAKRQVRYDMGFAYLYAGKLAEGQEIFESLGEYKESKQTASAIKKYMAAPDIKSVVSRYNSYIQLGDFLDSAQKAVELEEDVIAYGFKLYDKGEFTGAKSVFLSILEHAALADSDRTILSYYMEAIGDWEAISRVGMYGDADTWMLRLKQLDEKIDVGPVLLSDIIIRRFLNGSWYSSDGGRFVYDYSEATFYFSRVYVPYANGYRFYDQALKISPGGAVVARFRYLGYNSIEVTDVNGYRYTFYRE